MICNTYATETYSVTIKARMLTTETFIHSGSGLKRILLKKYIIYIVNEWRIHTIPDNILTFLIPVLIALLHILTIRFLIILNLFPARNTARLLI